MKNWIPTLIFLATAAAHADIDAIERQFQGCADKAGSTAEMNACAEQGYQAADKELNTLYASILKQNSDADPDSQEIVKRLRASERAWVAYRDTDCALAGVEMLGGSGEGPIVGSCLARRTIERVRELQEIFEPK